MLVVIPGYIYINFGDTIQLDEFGIHVENRSIFGKEVGEHMLMKNLPKIIGMCKELQELRCLSQKEAEMVK